MKTIKLTEDEFMQVVDDACEEIFHSESGYANKLCKRVSELMAERKRIKEMEQEDTSTGTRSEKEYVVVVYDPKGTILPETLEGYVVQKLPATYDLADSVMHQDDKEPQDWAVSEIDSRLDRWMQEEHLYGRKGKNCVMLDHYMHSASKSNLKKWGMQLKQKTPALIMPVQLPLLTGRLAAIVVKGDKLNDDITHIEE